MTLTLALLLAVAQQPAPDTASQLARSAEQDLARGIADLNALREAIAAEKLPLARELTQLEDELTALRRAHDDVVRKVDEGNLGMVSIKTEMKAREDELTYVGGLLNEYVRNFETKVNVSELQYCGTVIDAAKRAEEDALLAMAEKLDVQLACVDRSVKRLNEAIGGLRFPGVGVDMEGAIADGQFAIFGPVALFSAPGAAGIVVPQTGSTKPLIRPLEGALQAGLAALVETGSGLLPLDPSLGGALKALVQKFNLVHTFEKGGPIMWPLLAASILALGVVIERLLFLLSEKVKRDPKALEKFFTAVSHGETGRAIQIGKDTKYGIVRALGYALAHRETSLANALLYAQAKELKRFQRGIPILDTVITLAPLLGLLGTVTGMMGSFSIIQGELSSPGAITGGIAEALIATAFGLGIAITALLPFNYLNTKTDQVRHDLETAATQLQLLVEPRAAETDVVHAAAPPPDESSVDWAAVPTARQAAQAEARELGYKRAALQSKMAELKLRMDEQELEMERLASEERGLHQKLVPNPAPALKD